MTYNVFGGTLNPTLLLFFYPYVRSQPRRTLSFSSWYSSHGVQGHLVTICDDNSLHLWRLDVEDGHSQLNLVRTISAQSRSALFKNVRLDQVRCAGAHPHS